MSLSTTSNRNTYVASSGQTVFAYQFRVDVAADMEVFVDNILQVLTTDYTISGLGSDSGGNVTFVVGRTSGEEIILLRTVILTQLSNYVANEGIPSDRIEDNLDKLTMIAQQLDERINRDPFTATVFSSGVNFLAVWKTVTELSGFSTLTYDGTDLTVQKMIIGDIGSPSHAGLSSTDSMRFLIDSDNDSVVDTFRWLHNASTILMILQEDGILTLGSGGQLGAASGASIVLPNTNAYVFAPAAGGSLKYGLFSDANNDLSLEVPASADKILMAINTAAMFTFDQQNGGPAIEFQDRASSDHAAPSSTGGAVVYVLPTASPVKHQLMVRFNTGAAQVIATEP